MMVQKENLTIMMAILIDYQVNIRMSLSLFVTHDWKTSESSDNMKA